MPVPVLDLSHQYAQIKDEVQAVLEEILTSQRFVLGAFGKALEERVADSVGTPFAVGVASGTDALLLGLKALGLKPGEGVLTTAFTFFATAGAIHNAGGKPFFADIDPVSFNLDPSQTEAFLRESCTRNGEGIPVHGATGTPIRVLLPVHLYGQCAPMTPLRALAESYGLLVLEDACQAFGARYEGDRAGSLGHAAAFSFFPTKNLGGAGDGGMVTTADQGLAERVALLRVHGSRERYLHEVVGINSRLDEIQAAILGVKLARVDEWNDERRRLAFLYDEGLAGIPGVLTPRVEEACEHIFHQYVIRTPRRDDLKAFLEERGIGSMVYYPVPLHLQPCFRFLGMKEGDLPQTERAAREVLALPIFPGLTASEVSEVCDAVRAFHTGSR